MRTKTEAEAYRAKMFKHMREASKLVQSWPKWKQNILGGYRQVKKN